MATTAHSGVPAKAPSRKDLSGPALRTFFRIADAWGLKEAEQMKLGLDSRSTFQTWKRGAVAAIPKDALERISYVMGIYKGLKMLLPRTANEWVRKPMRRRCSPDARRSSGWPRAMLPISTWCANISTHSAADGCYCDDASAVATVLSDRRKPVPAHIAV
jgi:hypothetical protein